VEEMNGRGPREKRGIKCEEGVDTGKGRDGVGLGMGTETRKV
jgi:hypothetical protein